MNYGDRLILFTDGITEARNNSGEIFGLDKLVDLLQSGTGTTVDQMISDIIDQLGKYKYQGKNEDDISIKHVQIMNKRSMATWT